MTYTLTYEQALAGLRRAVEEKGADYVDPRAPGGTCEYFPPDKDGVPQPGCIVGHLLYYHNVVNADFEGQSVKGLILNGHIEIDSERTRDLLEAVQHHQDDGETWGEAVELAIEAAERFSDVA